MLDLILPPRCLACARPGRAVCLRCASTLRPAPPVTAPGGLDRCAALVAYEGTGRQLVAGLKFRNRHSALADLAGAMAGLAPPPPDIDVVTWAPTTRRRRRQRGYDQAELLARAVAGRLGRPARCLLDRGDGPAQTGRSQVERGRGPAFAARGRRGARVLLVDDVVTTGATIGAAAAALRRAGAVQVAGLALAATPLKVVTAAADNTEGEGGSN